MEMYGVGRTYKLTAAGKRKAMKFLKGCSEKRKKILVEKKDTAYETTLPTIDDIVNDISLFGIDEDGEYFNTWGVTDHFNSDMLTLVINKDMLAQ